MALLIRKREINNFTTIEVNKDGNGWRQLPNGQIWADYSNDDSSVIFRNNFNQSYISSDYIPFDQILDADNGNTPFTAETLRNYLVENGFFRVAPGDSGGGQLELRVEDLENKQEIYALFEILTDASTQTTGTITLPQGATINSYALGEYGDCVPERANGSNQPIYEEDPRDVNGEILNVDISSIGVGQFDWQSSELTNENVGIIFVVNVSTLDFNEWSQADKDKRVEVAGLDRNIMIQNEGVDVIENPDALDFTGEIELVRNGTSIEVLTKLQTPDLVSLTGNFTLPDALSYEGYGYRLINRSNAVYRVETTGTDTIEGHSFQDIYPNETFDIQLNGTNWTL